MKAGFHYIGGEMCVDEVPLSSLAEEHGTPLYVYSGALLQANYRRVAKFFSKMDSMIAYSVKSNSNLGVLSLLAKEGSAFDIVSGGELERMKKIGVTGDRIIFAGVGKREDEMQAALKHKVLEFNLESEGEAERLNAVAAARGVKAPVAIRINPDIDAKTHVKISTGKKENKFGISLEHAKALAHRIVKEMKSLELMGLHCHIGSQILDSSIHPRVVAAVVGFAEATMAETGARFKTLNFGGGFGIAYKSEQEPLDLKPFAAALQPEMKRLGVKLIVEPGRSICAPAGVLLTRVEYIKHGIEKTFVILDSSMSELMRPTLYDAHHEILPVKKVKKGASKVVDFVGPVCESGDYLALNREAYVPAQGDLLSIMDAGAYGFVMASHYNTRPNPAEILVVDGKPVVARERETVKDLLKLDRPLS
jgi:diaminopimelate decarboxylase